MTKRKLFAYAKLAALAVLRPMPDWLVRLLLRPFSRWLWPTSPEDAAAYRRQLAKTFADGLAPKPTPTPGSTGPRPSY